MCRSCLTGRCYALLQVEFAQDFTVTYRGTFKVSGAHMSQSCASTDQRLVSHASQLPRWLLAADLHGQAVLLLSSANMPPDHYAAAGRDKQARQRDLRAVPVRNTQPSGQC
jgi:hypothetical protein